MITRRRAAASRDTALPSAAALLCALTLSLPARADVPPGPPPGTATAVFSGTEGYEGVTMDGEPRPDLLTPGEHLIPVGAHLFVFTGEAGPPAQVRVAFTAGERQTVSVPSPRCDVPLGGVAPPVEHHAGGCCGGSQGPSESASTKGSLLALGAVALALSRRRRKK